MNDTNFQIKKDQANRQFWDELCGTALAKSIGISDHTEKSLQQFDRAYMDLYPYLLKHVKPEYMKGQRVLEIGMGYGTLGNILAKNSIWYQGLDIAKGPVRMMNYRLKMNELKGNAVQGSALNMPFPDNSFEHVISIGCFHHTGNASRCVDETHRVLKKGGRCVIMLYNQFSYRFWMRWPRKTLMAFIIDLSHRGKVIESDYEQRKAYDYNSNGNAAPETTFTSIKTAKKVFKKFRKKVIHKENCDDLYIRNKWYLPRMKLLPVLGKYLGLDLYIEAWK
jgi:ubiquinone/menaquinone biosynthesis C-methylase UbiE